MARSLQIAAAFCSVAAAALWWMASGPSPDPPLGAFAEGRKGFRHYGFDSDTDHAETSQECSLSQCRAISSRLQTQTSGLPFT